MANRMKKSLGIFGVLVLGLILLMACSQAPKATISPAEFYKGKTVNWVVSSGAGSDTDLLARIIAPYLGQELGALVKVEAMGSSEGRNYIFTQGKPDGLDLVIHSSASLVSDDILKSPGVQFEAEKFLFVADVAPALKIMQVSPKMTYKNLEELRKAKGLKGGGTTAAGALAVGAAVAFEILGLDGKVINGFNGKGNLVLAVTRGEVDFLVTGDPGAQREEEEGKIRNFLMIGDKRSEFAPGVPTMVDLGVKVPKELGTVVDFAGTAGTAVALPPSVPQEKVEYLRQVFQKLTEKKALQDEIAKKEGLWRPFVPGKELQDQINGMKANKSLANQLNDILAKYAATQ